jgi:hypothetical protein
MPALHAVDSGGSMANPEPRPLCRRPIFLSEIVAMASYMTTMDMYARALGPELGALNSKQVSRVHLRILEIYEKYLRGAVVMQRKLSQRGNGVDFDAIRMVDSAERAKNRPAFLFELRSENILLCLPCGSSTRWNTPGEKDVSWMYQDELKRQYCDTWSMVAVPISYVADDSTTMQATEERANIVWEGLSELFKHIINSNNVYVSQGNESKEPRDTPPTWLQPEALPHPLPYTTPPSLPRPGGQHHSHPSHGTQCSSPAVWYPNLILRR